MPPPTVITSFPIGVPTGQQPNVHVRDTTNGYDLYTLNADAVYEFSGSSTKLMTVLLLLDYKSTVLDTEFTTITSGDVTQPMPPFSLNMAGFQAGDVISLRGLLAGVLLPSGTDACQAIARVIGNFIYAQAGNTGNQGAVRFVEQMNIRAAGLGMTNTTFRNEYGGSKTFGPDVVRNEISARDLSTVCTAALAVPVEQPR
jgi:D-alanyl-D-alanine carboxypeptidase (penicillin-binding protein 5/6)